MECYISMAIISGLIGVLFGGMLGFCIGILVRVERDDRE